MVNKKKERCFDKIVTGHLKMHHQFYLINYFYKQTPRVVHLLFRYNLDMLGTTEMPGFGIYKIPEAIHLGLAAAYLTCLNPLIGDDEPTIHKSYKFSMVYSGMEAFSKGTFDNEQANCKDCKVRAGDKYKYTGNLDAIIRLSSNDYIRINNKGDISHHASQERAQASAEGL